MKLPPVDRAAPADERYLRQVLLFGPEGQARLSRACVDVGEGGLAAAVAERYVAGAGAEVARGPAGPSAPAEGDLADEASREILAGARAAAAALLRAAEAP